MYVLAFCLFLVIVMLSLEKLMAECVSGTGRPREYGVNSRLMTECAYVQNGFLMRHLKYSLVGGMVLLNYGIDLCIMKYLLSSLIFKKLIFLFTYLDSLFFLISTSLFFDQFLIKDLSFGIHACTGIEANVV